MYRPPGYILTILARPSEHEPGAWWLWTTSVSGFDEELLKSIGWTVIARDPSDEAECDLTLTRQLDERWSFSRAKRRLLTE